MLEKQVFIREFSFKMASATLTSTPEEELTNPMIQKRCKISIFPPNHFGTAPVSISHFSQVGGGFSAIYLWKLYLRLFIS